MKILFILCALCFVTVQAEEDRPPLDPKTTANGYTRNNFCAMGAKKRISELNQLSANEIDKAKPLQKELNELLAKRNILKSFLDLRNDYQSSFFKIKQMTDTKQIANVDEFKRLLRSSMIFEALMATTKVEESNHNDIGTLCDALEKKKNQTAFCSYMNSVKIKYVFKSEVKGINETLQKYNEAKSHLTADDKKDVSAQLKSIYATIPQSINPEEVLSTILSKAPDLVAAMGSERKDIEDCFKDKIEACGHLMTDHKDRIKEIMQGQLSDVHRSFASAEFDRLIKESDDIKADKEEQLKTLAKEKLTKAVQLARDQNATLNGIGLNDESIENFNETCSKDDKESQTKCANFSEELRKFFEDKTKTLNEQIAKKTNELNTMSSTASALSKIEKMKQYVAQKYIRSCQNATEAEVASNLSTCNFGLDSAQADPASSPEVSSLNNKLSQIISRIVSDNKLSKQKGELGAFSKNELESYMSYCQNTSVKDFSDICADIHKEAIAVKDVKELKEWEDYSNKYWIVPSKKDPKGYEVYERKSNSRIFAEGVSQSVGTLFPAWMGNMNLKYQINALESQALYMKQMNYMYTQSSPWSMGFPYFQGNYYAFPTQPTNYSSPFSTSTGFNLTN